MHFFRDIVQFFRPRLVHRNCRVEPGIAGFVAGKQSNEVFLRHFALLNAELHDQTFLRTNAVHHDAHTVDQVVKLLRHQAELFEYFRQFQDLFLSGSVTATFRFDGVTRYNVLSAQFRKFSRASSGSMLLSSSALSSSPSSSSSSSSSSRSSWESSEPT